MPETDQLEGAEESAPERNLDDILGFARSHGEMMDTRKWVADLEDMLRIAWDLMTPEQQVAFREHPDVLALAEAAGERADLT
ncbi:hypothetical protein [Paracraurococcus lichenis]|uniref:Uncharacterized protein n=1 Tax=Paracraurococcus lichenis TaxID=3064888 RepID=A0ABT9EBF6_9PROT|nr:hypothetical protein [Paracraurococcus sp. LOR1-02]MDO9713472.1 hypothetical protein [Paracraurococcus sp. LOR1-02]